MRRAEKERDVRRKEKWVATITLPLLLERIKTNQVLGGERSLLSFFPSTALNHIKPLSITNLFIFFPSVAPPRLIAAEKSAGRFQGYLVGELWLISRLCDEVLIIFKIRWGNAF